MTIQRALETIPGQKTWDRTDKADELLFDQLTALEIQDNPDELAQEAMAAIRELLEAIESLKEAQCKVESKRSALEDILNHQPEPMTFRKIVRPLAMDDPDLPSFLGGNLGGHF